VAGPERPAARKANVADVTASGTAARADTRPGLAEVLVAFACFAVLCVAALSRPVKLLEPDDYAYRASIVALTEGHILLTDAQYRELAARRGWAAAAASRSGRSSATATG
jgi:hypothetical protein